MFDILSPDDRSPRRRDALANRELPPSLGSHKEAAQHYQPSPDLVDAVNVALAVGAPLLLTGEPGTGKTQVGHYLSWFFDVPLFPLYVRSSTTAEDLLYRFDAVAYLHAAQDTNRQGTTVDRGEFVEEGPLWQAYKAEGPSVVLIDEIDKAPRDFPNDLLNVLDQHSFRVPEKGPDCEVKHEKAAPPIVVITSNSERRLPEPFLRRCIFHHIDFTEDLLRRAVEARVGDFPTLAEDVREQAIRRFLELRAREVRKKPATAELLVWLTILSARGGVTVEDLQVPPADLPALAALIKDRDDLTLLR